MGFIRLNLLVISVKCFSAGIDLSCSIWCSYFYSRIERNFCVSSLLKTSSKISSQALLNCSSALVSAGAESVFFSVVGIVLWFGYIIMLIIH